MLAVVISSESVKFYDSYQAEKAKLNIDAGVYSPKAFYRACNIMKERWKSHGENYYQMKAPASASCCYDRGSLGELGCRGARCGTGPHESR